MLVESAIQNDQLALIELGYFGVVFNNIKLNRSATYILKRFVIENIKALSITLLQYQL